MRRPLYGVTRSRVELSILARRATGRRKLGNVVTSVTLPGLTTLARPHKHVSNDGGINCSCGERQLFFEMYLHALLASQNMLVSIMGNMRVNGLGY